MTTPLITNAELAALETEYKLAQRAAVDSPDNPSLQSEADRCRKVYENRRETAEQQFPGGLVPTALPAKRMGGRVPTRRR